jgi:hypothetical protein
MLVGSLPFSGRFRGVLAESMDQPHLIEAMDGVLRRLGGTAGQWRVDRMATVINPGHRSAPGELRSGGQALRGDRGGVPTPAWQPQRLGGEVHPQVVGSGGDDDSARVDQTKPVAGGSLARRGGPRPRRRAAW